MSPQQKKTILLFLWLFLILPISVSAAGLINPLGSGATIHTVIGRVIKFMLGLSGSVALLMFVWGGFQFLSSAGDPGKVKKGKETLTMAVLGLAVIFGAYILVNALITALTTGSVTS